MISILYLVKVEKGRNAIKYIFNEIKKKQKKIRVLILTRGCKNAGIN